MSDAQRGWQAAASQATATAMVWVVVFFTALGQVAVSDGLLLLLGVGAVFVAAAGIVVALVLRRLYRTKADLAAARRTPAPQPHPEWN